MEKRNKLWRRRHQWRLFKAKLLLMAANQHWLINEAGIKIQHPHWFDYARETWCFKYKTMRTPCSCNLCKGEKYNRIDYKQTTTRTINESLDS